MELEPTNSPNCSNGWKTSAAKTKVQIATLQERITGQTNEMTELTRRIHDLDNSLKSMQIALGKVQQTDRVLDEFKPI